MSRARVSLLAVVLCTGVLVASCRTDARDDAGVAEGQVRIGTVVWYVDYDAAVEVAREQDKALWVHFGENPG